ncbi:MAG: pilus assembly protein [Magnetospirillum sp. WYHS-4]
MGIIRRWVGNERGASAVEFALLAPTLLVVAMGVIDLGLGMFHKMELAGAARAGAQYAILKGYSSSTIQTVVQGSTNLTGITVVSSRSCECSNGSTPSGTAPSCTCSGSGVTVQKFISVTASYSYTPIFAYFKPTYSLAETVTVREE